MKRIVLFFFVMAVTALVWGTPLEPLDLKCNYRVNPLGMDDPTPRFSWVLNDPARGAVQSAYQIQAAVQPELQTPHRSAEPPALAPDSDPALSADLWNNESLLWDSGRVESRETAQRVYAGQSLASATRIFWRVRTWDAAGAASPWSEPAWFETGLMKPEDWQGAQWISSAQKNRQYRYADETAAGMARQIQDLNYWLAGGLVCFQKIPCMLSEYGFADHAFEGMTNTRDRALPWSAVKHKGDAAWEVYHPEGSYRARKTSKNHPNLGGVDMWFYRHLAGIRPGRDGDAFRRFILKPDLTREMEQVRCSYDSINGRIVSNWNRSGSKLEWQVTIPANTTAEVWFPSGPKGVRIEESGKPVGQLEHARFIKSEPGFEVYEIGAGEYHFMLTDVPQ